MKKGEQLTVECVDLDDAGAGVSEVAAAGKVFRLHVPGAAPQEQIEVLVEHVSPHRAEAWGVLRKVTRPSPSRVAPACPSQGDCGGCVLQHLAVGEQVQWKTHRVSEALRRRPALSSMSVAPCLPSPRDLGYRNRSKLVYGRPGAGATGGKPLVLGAYAPRSHRIVDLAGCRVVEPVLDRTAATLLSLLERHGARPYDERTATGLLRYVVLRANARDEVLAVLVTFRRDWPEGRSLAVALRAAEPAVVGVVQDVNTSLGNVIHGEETVSLDGASTLLDEVGGVRLRLSPQAFFQANRLVAAAAYRAIVEGLRPRPGDRAVDAFAGVGGIALTLAPHVGEVVGFEQHAGAVADAEASAALNGIGNARFKAGDAGALLSALDRAELVVLNPPRQGCEAAVLDAVARLRPRAVAYLSCDPDTLARDLERLVEAGYGAAQPVQPFDMMPHTPHVETLALLRRGD